MVTDEAKARSARWMGDERDDFRGIVERHSRGVFRVAYRMTGNEQDAEEVVQETFLRAYRGLNRFQERAQFSTWLHRIAVNCALDLIRSRQRHNENRVDVGGEAGDEERGPLLAAVSSDPAPDRVLISAEMGRKLRAAMARLSPTERAAFVLRHYEGQSIEQIAATLKLSVGATKNGVFRAVQKLRAALKPWLS